MARRIVTVFGGSGFIGRHLVKRLAARGYTVRAAVRDVEDAAHLRPMGDAGLVIPWPADIKDAGSVRAAIEGADAVINLVGILSPWGKQTFRSVHVDGAQTVAAVSAALGIRRLIHMSALGAAAESESRYAQTKAQGEDAVRAAFPTATIIRPSVVFGPEDRFFNLFAGLTRLSVTLPVIGAPLIPKVELGGDYGIRIDFFGRGGPQFQPVYVGDVADAMVNALEDNSAAGQTYELGGPATYSFKALMEIILSVTGRSRILMPVCFIVAEIAGFFIEKLPKPWLTRDQVALMHTDNVVSGDLPGLSDLGVQGHTVEAVVPTYLHRFRTRTHKRIVQG
jgi:uncharacterized protein YbjT (DUF2867 family)